MKNIFLLSLIFVSSMCFAKEGSEGVGGGHVVKCEGKPAVTLDYYNAVQTLDDGQTLLNPETDQVLNIIAQRLDKFEFDYLPKGSDFRKIYNDLGSLKTWAPVDLKIIGDHNLIYRLPKECTLEQGAAQEDQSYGYPTMYKNPHVANQLSEGQKTLLRIHEAFYYYLRRYQIESSAPVRTLLSKLMLSYLSDEELTTALANFSGVIELAINKSFKKYICSATIFYTYPGDPNRIDPDTVKAVTRYGATISDAFFSGGREGSYRWIACNKFQQIDDQHTICIERANIGSNCRLNE